MTEVDYSLFDFVTGSLEIRIHIPAVVYKSFLCRKKVSLIFDIFG